MYCSRCGIQISNDANFCKRCGARQDDDLGQQIDPLDVVREEISANNNSSKEIKEESKEETADAESKVPVDVTNMEVISEIDSQIQDFITNVDAQQEQDLESLEESQYEDDNYSVSERIESKELIHAMDRTYLEMIQILELIQNDTSKKVLHIENMISGLGKKSKLKRPVRNIASISNKAKWQLRVLLFLVVLLLVPIYFFIQDQAMELYLLIDIITIAVVASIAMILYCKEKHKVKLKQKRYDLQYKKERYKLKKVIVEDRARVSLELEQCKELEDRRERLQVTLNNTYALLQELYAIQEVPAMIRKQELLSQVYDKYCSSTESLSQVIKGVAVNPETVLSKDMDVKLQEIESRMSHIQKDVEKAKREYEQLFSDAQKQFLEEDISIDVMLTYSQIQNGVMQTIEICEGLM